ncbi:IPT/TIG domain-containing protein [Polaribacter sp. R77954]|uniref:IPT/TIG domain-containing protein n=1 Tax=Polaribacter sp. R77954 TaxID=3093870 RepID=UPI0037CA0FF8
MKKYFLLFIILVGFACQEEQVIPPNNNFVKIESISSSVLDSGGVTLKGTIENVELDLDYGFLVYSYPTINPNLFSMGFMKRNTGLYNGDFELTFNENLYKNQTYYYRAFAYSSNKTIFGQEKEFLSSGSLQPIITEVTPEIAHLNDTVSITGKHFSDEITLAINNNSFNVLVSNDSLVQFLVKDYPSEDNNDEILIKKRTGEEVTFKGFGIYIPEVYEISPNPAYDTDTLLIHGNHFDLRKEFNSVYKDNYKLEVLESTRTTLKVKGNGYFGKFKPAFKIRAQRSEIEILEALEIVEPKITKIPTVIKFNNTFTINGTNFPNVSECRFHTVYAVSLQESIHLNLENCNRDSLSVVLNSSSLLKDFYQNKVTLSFFGKTQEYNLDHYIDEPIIRVFGSNLQSTHIYNNQLYAFTQLSYNGNYYVSKFDDQEKKFNYNEDDKIDDITVGYWSVNTFHEDTYYYMKNISGVNYLHSYNFITKTHKTLLQVPGDGRLNGFLKGSGNYLYYGLGSFTGFPQKNFNDILRYSIKDNTWEKFAEIDYSDISEIRRDYPLVFFMNNAIFIGGGHQYKNDMYAIDLDSRVVAKKKSLPFFIDNNYQNSHIIKNGKLLYFKNSFYEYDPFIDEWTILGAFKNESVHNLESFNNMIIHKNEVYGFNGSFYKFNNEYF